MSQYIEKSSIHSSFESIKRFVRCNPANGVAFVMKRLRNKPFRAEDVNLAEPFQSEKSEIL